MKNKNILNIVLFQPEIPHNTGAVGRTCVALGAKLWLIRPLGFRITDKNLRRAGLDYWKFLEWEILDDWDALLAKLPDTSRYFFFTKTATCPYIKATFSPGDTFIFGSESNGLPPSLLEKYAAQRLRIPIRQETRSLNLSVSVGIAAYEAWRQITILHENTFFP
ncbi:MAG: tRNA (cytidine(34)-2'-O)-methyltransferase [Planctomycetia bacterium]|nr:tRNA (cytidine(34)-2'-O)-methyltransferase [Planctomycetia bacterium]